MFLTGSKIILSEDSQELAEKQWAIKSEFLFF